MAKYDCSRNRLSLREPSMSPGGTLEGEYHIPTNNSKEILIPIDSTLETKHQKFYLGHISSVAPTFSSSTSSLLTTYHPGLNPKTLESIAQMESIYEPGSVEYELAVDYVRSSSKSKIPTLWGTDIPNASVNSLKSVYNMNITTPSQQSIPLTGPKNSYRSTSYNANLDNPDYCRGKDVENDDEMALMYHKESVEIPRGALLFLFGFLFLPLWWVGAIYPRKPHTKYQQQWRIYNRMISLFSLPLLGFLIGLIVWNIVMYQSNTI